jgi:Leucine-rich repeat (LRR) protein
LALIERAQREGWKKLDLSKQGLTVLPEAIARLTALKVLYVNGNKGIADK